MKRNNKGFTLAELLIVVAIIAVLVAIAIPVFNTQLEKARDSTDQANIRSAYAEVQAGIIDGSITGTSKTVDFVGKGTNNAWDNLGSGESFKIGDITIAAKEKATHITFTFTTDGGVTAISLS